MFKYTSILVLRIIQIIIGKNLLNLFIMYYTLNL